MIKSVFITKNSGETVSLQQFTDAHGIQLSSQSFLQFQPVAFKLPSHFDVIFFGSPRAVMFFQSRFSIPDNVSIACVGGKTAALLQSMGHQVAFNGENKGSITDVADSFKDWLGDRSVLFPVSTKSLGTISKRIASDQSYHVECYETIIQEHEVSAAYDVYVFTSPSNVEGFFAENTLPESASVIAWGESTRKALEAQYMDNITVLQNPSMKDLIDLLEDQASTNGK
ncbi:MAG: uroporphyrinogen-III synthase [bacterium]|nr:uroporphyrinogen-III synthase [bacterium]